MLGENWGKMKWSETGRQKIEQKNSQQSLILEEEEAMFILTYSRELFWVLSPQSPSVLLREKK